MILYLIFPSFHSLLSTMYRGGCN